MSDEILNIKRMLVLHAVKLHILSHNLSDSNNQIIVDSDIKIDWDDCSVSFKAIHSGTQCNKKYEFYELDLEGLNEA